MIETGVNCVMINHVQKHLDADTLVLASMVNIALQSVTSATMSKRKSIKFTVIMNLMKVLIIAILSLKSVSMCLQFKL